MKIKYDNEARRQCFDVNNLAMVQFDEAVKSMKSIINDDFKNITKIIVTGCGDSYLAAIEAKQAFDKYLKGTACEMVYMRAIDIARFYEFDNEENTLVVAVSASGGPARIEEILKRSKKNNAIAVALTNNADSQAAKNADLVYLTNTPDFPDKMPGLRNYYASLVSLYVMAATFGEIKNNKDDYVKKLRAELFEYNEIFKAYMQGIDAVAFATAVDFVEMKGFEVVADSALNACGRFVAAKYAEVSGDMCSFIDSESYCHVNTFIRPKHSIGTYAMLLSHDNNINRMVETINIMLKRDKRSVLLVSDKKSSEIGISEAVRQCILPAPKKDYSFLYLLYAYIPGSLAAAYHAALINQPYFRGGGVFFDPAINTLKTNEIKII